MHRPMTFVTLQLQMVSNFSKLNVLLKFNNPTISLVNQIPLLPLHNLFSYKLSIFRYLLFSCNIFYISKNIKNYSLECMTLGCSPIYFAKRWKKTVWGRKMWSKKININEQWKFKSFNKSSMQLIEVERIQYLLQKGENETSRSSTNVKWNS